MTPCKHCGQPRNTRNPAYALCDEHYDEYNRNASLKSLDKLRTKVREFYGSRCAHCGITDPRVLQLDHVCGDGADERRERGNSLTVYRRALREPERYQLLCANCNWIKRWEQNEHRGRPRNPLTP